MTLFVTAMFVAAPIVATLLTGISADSSSLFFSKTGLGYFSGTIILCVSVGIGAGAIGALTALIISLTEFPGRRVLAVLLALPFAIPAYVAAYVYADMLGPFGPVAQTIGVQNLPEIRSMPGAVFILTLMTYPYVYLAMRASFAGRSSALLEAARMLGVGPVRAALNILLTAGRPALAGGLALVLMETAADFGVADYFGVKTLSVGIFRTWQGLGDLAGATQLAAGLFLVALIFVLLEDITRRGESAENTKAYRNTSRIKLAPHHAVIAILFCAIPIMLGFIFPAADLIGKLNSDLSAIAGRNLVSAISNTSMIAVSGALIAISLALALAYSARQMRSLIGKTLLRIASLGYAIPGAVIAIGILSLTTGQTYINSATLFGGVIILLYAYTVRFLTAGYNSAAAGLSQISIQMDHAARSLGAGGWRILTEIHWPQVSGAVLAGAAIIAIDIAKELPATLLLRPFNFETLSTHIYRLASDERLADAAPAALILIGLGLVPTLALTFLSGHKKTGGNLEAPAGQSL